MVGFGGGSSYTAMLGISGIDYSVIPKISLICNLLVVAGGSLQFFKSGHLKKDIVLPFVLSSVPMSFLGGSFRLSEKAFYLILGVSLLLCGLRILFIRVKEANEIKRPTFAVASFTGGLLGALAGMVGIGGGIFLSPIIMNMGWARSKESAAVASVFILLNSLSGLAGQFYKNTTFVDGMSFLPLFIAVIIGGQIGSRLGTNPVVSYKVIQRGTAILTLFISARLLYQQLG